MWRTSHRLWTQLGVIVLALTFSLAAVAQGMSAAKPISQADKLRQAQEAVRDKIRHQLGPTRSYALVIGVSEFNARGWKNLPGVTTEVAEVEAAFRAHGFIVPPRPDDGRMTKAEMKKTIEDFIGTYGKYSENRLVIYVATHGYADVKDPNGYGYLVATDSKVPGEDFPASAYSVNELSQALTGIAAQHVYLFFNACFSGALIPSDTRGGPKAGTNKQKPLEALSDETARWTLDLLSHNARLVLTAGSDKQEVPDRNNPFSKAVIDGLNGFADADADGIILGTELAQYVRGRVARETRKKNKPNDAVFAILPKTYLSAPPRPDAPPQEQVDIGLQGDYVFLSPKGPGGDEGFNEGMAITQLRRDRLPATQFTDCADCPIMVEVPEGDSGRKTLAMAKTETTYAEWDACYRELGCRRYLDDDGKGRGDRPAAGVSYLDSLEFVTWMNTQEKPESRGKNRCETYMLPTAEQWSRAAAAGTRTRFFWGDEPDGGQAVCWGCGEGDGFDGSAPLKSASLPANGFGLHDMTGNLWEWVREVGTVDGKEVDICDLAAIRTEGGCAPGPVMGGSYATGASGLSTVAVGHIPRTGNDRVIRADGGAGTAPFSLPTVGFRVACTLRQD